MASYYSKINRAKEKIMIDKKVVFIAFAVEDERLRDILKGQSLNIDYALEYVDMPVKEPDDSNWLDSVRVLIKRADGVLAIASKNSSASAGQKFEIACALEENKKILGIWSYSDKEDKPDIPGVNTIAWCWNEVTKFIDSL
jgi:hypothetical protein